MKRLFYFTGYRLSVLYWKGKELVGSSSFEPTEQGLEKFRNYLSQSENISAKFLVDVIEEDFRNETIPHVGSKDRKAVISRFVDRYFRLSHSYFYSDVIGREKTGRKDDIVLLSAMTNPELIQPWMTIIEECEVPLSGIWTLPLISKQLLKTIKATTGVVLLVSQQVNSNVRQTLFRDGKLVASRQSIINLDMNDISGIGELALPEVNRTIEFLRAQNLILNDEVVNLHILGSKAQMLSLQQSFKADDNQTVTVHPVSQVQKHLGLKGVGDKYSDGIFAWLCISQGASISHYGVTGSFNRYYNMLAATALYVASLMIVIVGVLLTQSNISAALEHEKAIVLLGKEEKNYKELYSKKFKDFEEVFENVGVMNAAVELAEQIKINSATSPLDFLINLSQILNKDNVGTLHIDKIEWQAININEKDNKIDKANFTSTLSAKHNAIVTGRIDVSEHDYRESIEHIQDIVNLLNRDSRIENVETIKMPVDLRSHSKFASESGVDTKRHSDRSTTGVFTLRVTMKAPDHV